MGLFGSNTSPVGVCPKCREETPMEADNFHQNFTVWRCDNCAIILGVTAD
jgi:predicted  nucleic acid-binding Zn ribbon protein